MGLADGEEQPCPVASLGRLTPRPVVMTQWDEGHDLRALGAQRKAGLVLPGTGEWKGSILPTMGWARASHMRKLFPPWRRESWNKLNWHHILIYAFIGSSLRGIFTLFCACMFGGPDPCMAFLHLDLSLKEQVKSFLYTSWTEHCTYLWVTCFRASP